MAFLLCDEKLIIGGMALLNVNIHSTTLTVKWAYLPWGISCKWIDDPLWCQYRKSKRNECNVGCDEAAAIYESACYTKTQQYNLFI